MPLPKPGSYHELVARANSSSWFNPEHSTPPATVVGGLSATQLKALEEVVNGARKLAKVKSEIFAVSAAGLVVGFNPKSSQHSVVDGRCSCPHNRLRAKPCKHLEAFRCCFPRS